MSLANSIIAKPHNTFTAQLTQDATAQINCKRQIRTKINYGMFSNDKQRSLHQDNVKTLLTARAQAFTEPTQIRSKRREQFVICYAP